MPGTQTNQAGSAVALNALFVYRRWQPLPRRWNFCCDQGLGCSQQNDAPPRARVTSGRNNTTRGFEQIASDVRKTAFSIAAGRAAGKEQTLSSS